MTQEVQEAGVFKGVQLTSIFPKVELKNNDLHKLPTECASVPAPVLVYQLQFVI